MPKGLYRVRKRPARRRLPVKTNFSPRMVLGILCTIVGSLMILIYYVLKLIL